VFVTLQSPSRARNFRTAARHNLPSCATAQPRSLEGTLITIHQHVSTVSWCLHCSTVCSHSVISAVLCIGISLRWRNVNYVIIGDKYYQSEGRNSSYIRGAIKNFSAWPSSIRNKIKIVFASYCSKAQNTTCTIWLLSYIYFVHFSGRQLLAYDMEKRSYAVYWNDNFDRFVRSIACFVVLTQNWSGGSNVSSQIMSFEMNVCWVTPVSDKKFLRNLCTLCVSILDTHLTDTVKSLPLLFNSVASLLCYCNTVRWAWLDWGLSGWLTTLLQCFDTVGWVIRPVKISSAKWPKLCLVRHWALLNSTQLCCCTLCSHLTDVFLTVMQ